MDTPCIEWHGPRDSDGYGLLRIGGRLRRAHRVAWEEAHGEPVPPGKLIMHLCDNRPCVNPDHLRMGSHLDNSAYARQQGRLNGPVRSDRPDAHGRYVVYLRIPPDLKDRLMAIAATREVSLNSLATGALASYADRVERKNGARSG